MPQSLRLRLDRSLKGWKRNTVAGKSCPLEPAPKEAHFVAAIRMDPLGGSPHLRTLPMLRLTHPSDLQEVIVGCDADVGGLSSCQLAIAVDAGSDDGLPAAGVKGAKKVDKGKGLFRGVLKTEVSPEARKMGGFQKGGYAAFRTRVKKTLMGEELWNTEMHRYLRLRVRSSGDGMRYFVNLQTTSPVATDLYQHRLWTRQENEWEDVLIPFSDFALTNRGRISPTQIPMARDSVKTVGISVIEKEGPFELGIERIDCVSDESLELERDGKIEDATEDISDALPHADERKDPDRR